LAERADKKKIFEKERKGAILKNKWCEKRAG